MPPCGLVGGLCGSLGDAVVGRRVMALYPVCFHRSLIGVIENSLTACDKRCAGQLLAAPLTLLLDDPYAIDHFTLTLWLYLVDSWYRFPSFWADIWGCCWPFFRIERSEWFAWWQFPDEFPLRFSVSCGWNWEVCANVAVDHYLVEFVCYTVHLGISFFDWLLRLVCHPHVAAGVCRLMILSGRFRLSLCR